MSNDRSWLITWGESGFGREHEVVRVVLVVFVHVKVVVELLEGGLKIVVVGVFVVVPLVAAAAGFLGARRPEVALGHRLRRHAPRRRDQFREDGASAHCSERVFLGSVYVCRSCEGCRRATKRGDL